MPESRRPEAGEGAGGWHGESLSHLLGGSDLKRRGASLKLGMPPHPPCWRLLWVRVPNIACRTPIEPPGQTGRMLGARIHEHKLAVRRGDALSQVAAHTYEMGHEFNFAATKIIARARNKTGRELNEDWASDENSVNRFIDLAPAYRALRGHLQSCAVGR
ncbi:hypothetical protein SprV_0100074500 [Sparganum proliferum]